MSNLLVEVSDLSKMYRIFRRPHYRIMDLLGLPVPRSVCKEFWALRDINLTVTAGQRLGIIGRNGAGKSTLLKVVAGQLQPTAGKVKVHGQVQALMELGTGFHPEFSGRQNVFAALSYKGIFGKKANRLFGEIVEFAELEEFIDNPFKTYSSGMQARLAFSVSTVIEPEILIIDEILGAGDAYFAQKSGERMRELVGGGAAVLLVTHALDQVVRYCDQAIWIERGRMVRQGASLEIVRAYEEFVHHMEDRRLRAKNLKRRVGDYNAVQVEGYGDGMVLAFQLQGEAGTRCDIAEITFLREGQEEETLKVGDVQDTNTSHMAMVSLEGSAWSEPQKAEKGFYRSLTIKHLGPMNAVGEAVFYAYGLFPATEYMYRVRYRCNTQARLTLTISRNGKLLHDQVELPAFAPDWIEWQLPLGPLSAGNGLSPEEGKIQGVANEAPLPEAASDRSSQTNTSSTTRWPGEGSLVIEEVRLLGADDHEQAVFHIGAPLILSITYRAKRGARFPIIFAAVLYRLDGVVVSQNISDPVEMDLNSGERREVRLSFSPPDIGNGYYVFTVALYKNLDPYLIEEPQWYDMADRSYEFQIVGHPPLRTALFNLPAEWEYSGTSGK